MTILIAFLSAGVADARDRSAIFDIDTDSAIRVTGGDWKWEYFDDGSVHGKGAGDISISWGEGLKAHAKSAVLTRPPNRLILSGDVEVVSEQGTLKCETLDYDEAVGEALASGGVEVVYSDPPLRMSADKARYTLKESPDRFVSFNGNITLLTADDGCLECDVVLFYTEKNVLSIPGRCSGSLPMSFVDETDNPFYGRVAKFTGDTLDVLVGDDGGFSYAVSSNVGIDTGNAFISAPNLSVSSDGDGSENAILTSFNGADVSGWYVTPEGKRAEFSCRRLEIDRRSGDLRLSGRVKLDGEGFEMLTELLNLEYKDGAFMVSSDRRTVIDIDDLFFTEE